MNIINEIAQAFNPTNIHEEVALLRDQSIEAINHEDISAVILKDNLDALAVLAYGEYSVIVPNQWDDKFQPLQRKQAWNDMLWTITIHTLVEHDGLNSIMLGNIIRAWSEGLQDGVHNSLVKLDIDTCIAFADKYVAELQMMGCLNATPSQKHTVIDGELRSDMVFGITPAYIEYLQGVRKGIAEKRTMRFQPLIHKPQDWTDNFTGIGNGSNAKLIKGNNKKHVNKHVLSAVNKLQSVPYVVHADMVKLASAVVNNETFYRELWDIKPEDWSEQVLAWRAVTKLRVGQTYYFPVTMDFRGRMYYRGGLVTPQGSDFCKAAFIFQRALPLGQWGFGALCNSFANAMGMKGSQVQKIARTEEAVKNGKLSELLGDFHKFCTTVPKADHCQAWVLGLEIIKAERYRIEHGNYDTFMSPIPCHQDGTCNGLQHQAAITECITTARATNMCIASFKDVPMDVYGLVVSNCAEAVLRALGRDVGKNPVMTGSYGASDSTIGKKMKEMLTKLSIGWKKEYLIDMMDSMRATVPALEKLTNATKGIAMAVMVAGGSSIDWTTNDGFEVSQQYIDNEINIIRGGSFNAVVNRHDPKLDTRKMRDALSPNFIHSIDATHLRQTINACNYDVAAIHDSIASHACNYYSTNKILRVQMHAVHTEHDHLGELCITNNVDKPVFVDCQYNIEEVLDACNIFG